MRTPEYSAEERARRIAMVEARQSERERVRSLRPVGADVTEKLALPYDPRPEREIIGHPDLANGAYEILYEIDRVYISVPEAARRIMAGQPNVEIRWSPTEEDDRLLAEHREKMRKYIASCPP